MEEFHPIELARPGSDCPCSLAALGSSFTLKVLGMVAVLHEAWWTLASRIHGSQSVVFFDKKDIHTESGSRSS